MDHECCVNWYFELTIGFWKEPKLELPSLAADALRRPEELELQGGNQMRVLYLRISNSQNLRTPDAEADLLHFHPTQGIFKKNNQTEIKLYECFSVPLHWNPAHLKTNLGKERKETRKPNGITIIFFLNNFRSKIPSMYLKTTRTEEIK